MRNDPNLDFTGTISTLQECVDYVEETGDLDDLEDFLAALEYDAIRGETDITAITDLGDTADMRQKSEAVEALRAIMDDFLMVVFTVFEEQFEC